MRFRPCVIIPTYNHGGAIERTIRGVAPLGAACFVIDDGSSDGTCEILARLERELTWLRVVRRTENGGKGAAVKEGVRQALELEFSHALLLDADGQHDPISAKELLSCSESSPDLVILGAPRFERGAPRIRVYGREISNAFACLLTISFAIRDALCGLRVVPIERYSRTIAATRSSRMEFDLEVLVRLAWAGARFVNVPTAVSYPSDGISHFRYVRDNLMIAALIARLLLELPFRFPGILARRLTRLFGRDEPNAEATR